MEYDLEQETNLQRWLNRADQILEKKEVKSA